MGSNWSTGFASIQLNCSAASMWSRRLGAQGVAIGGGPLTVVTLAWLSISSSFALQQELCRRAGGHAEAALRSARLVAVGFGPSSETQGREIGQETQATQSAKHVVVFAQRRGVYPSAPAFAVVVLAYLLLVLSERFEAQHPEHVNWKDFRLLMMDGSHVALPRWKCLADYFGTTSNGKQTQTPQGRMVMLCCAIPFAFALRTDALERARASHRTPLGARLAAQRPGPMDRGFWSDPRRSGRLPSRERFSPFACAATCASKPCESWEKGTVW